MEVLVLILAVGINVGLAFIPANLARNKGYSFGGFWCLSFFASFLIAIIIAAAIQPKMRPMYAPPMPRVCAKCGVQLFPDSEFCTSCGTPAPPPQMAPAPQYAQAQYAQPQYAPPQPGGSVGAAQPMSVQPAGGFVGGYLGYIIFGVLFIAAFIFGATEGEIFEGKAFSYLLGSWTTFACLAFAAALTVRSKGPDLSLGALAGLACSLVAVGAYEFDSVGVGIVLAIVVCVFWGAVNGALVVFLRMPVLLVTVITALIISGVNYLVCDGQMLQIHDRGFLDFGRGAGGDVAPGFYILVPLLLIGAFLIVMFSRLGKPTAQREPKNDRKGMYFFAYMIAAVFACAAGIFMSARTGTSMPEMGTGYETTILLVFAVMMMCRTADNRIAPVLMAFAASLFIVILNFALSMVGAAYFIHQLISGVIALGLVILTYVTRRDVVQNMIRRV